MSRLAAFPAPRSTALIGCPGDLTALGAGPLLCLCQPGYPGTIIR